MTEKKESNKLDQIMNSADKSIIKKLKQPRSMHKLIRMFNNDFCPSCKSLAYVKSNRPMSDYCDGCQAIATKVLEKILK